MKGFARKTRIYKQNVRSFHPFAFLPRYPCSIQIAILNPAASFPHRGAHLSALVKKRAIPLLIIPPSPPLTPPAPSALSPARGCQDDARSAPMLPLRSVHRSVRHTCGRARVVMGERTKSGAHHERRRPEARGAVVDISLIPRRRRRRLGRCLLNKSEEESER